MDLTDVSKDYMDHYSYRPDIVSNYRYCPLTYYSFTVYTIRIRKLPLFSYSNIHQTIFPLHQHRIPNVYNKNASPNTDIKQTRSSS